MSAGSSSLARACSQSILPGGKRLVGGSRSAAGMGSAAPRSSSHAATRRPIERRSFTCSATNSQEEPAVHLATLAAKDPVLYDTLRPQPQSAYVALAHRIKLISHKTDAQTRQRRVQALVQACTHPSFAKLMQKAVERYGEEEAQVGIGKGIVRKGSPEEAGEGAKASRLDGQYLDASSAASHDSLAVVGNSLLGIIASEHLHLRYPNLPNRVIKAALSAFVGPNTLADVASELGMAGKGVVRWERRPTKMTKDTRLRSRPASNNTLINEESPEKLLSRTVHADALRSVITVLFQEQGMAAARTFIETHLLSRTIPLASFLKFDNPKRILSQLCEKLGKERPQSRMLAETGRLSINAVFVVGVYSGEEKLGEGTGSAIRMAEYRAAEDALRRFYLKEAPVEAIAMPSTTLDAETGAAPQQPQQRQQRTVWDIDAVALPFPVFQPMPIGQSEIVYGSKN